MTAFGKCLCQRLLFSMVKKMNYIHVRQDYSSKASVQWKFGFTAKKFFYILPASHFLGHSYGLRSWVVTLRVLTLLAPRKVCAIYSTQCFEPCFCRIAPRLYCLR